MESAGIALPDGRGGWPSGPATDCVVGGVDWPKAPTVAGRRGPACHFAPCSATPACVSDGA
eukprot:9153534-Alexandrium_andersonii.AAC.1